MQYKILFFLFLSCTLVLSQLQNKNVNDAKSETKSWLEEEKEVAKKLLSRFVDGENNGFQNLETDDQPQDLRTADGVYRISLCFFKDDEAKDKMNRNQPGVDGNTNLPTPNDTPRQPTVVNVPRADNDNENKNYSEICALKPETGMCRASFTAYYYNPAREDCFQFVYGGCGGNENKFRSREDCLEKCKNKRIVYPQRLRKF